MLMSFVSSFQTLMEVSDIDKAQQKVYGKNPRKQIVKGKEIA